LGDVPHRFQNLASELPPQRTNNSLHRANRSSCVVPAVDNQPIRTTAHGATTAACTTGLVQGATNLQKGAVEDVFECATHVAEIGRSNEQVAVSLLDIGLIRFTPRPCQGRHRGDLDTLNIRVVGAPDCRVEQLLNAIGRSMMNHQKLRHNPRMSHSASDREGCRAGSAGCLHVLHLTAMASAVKKSRFNAISHPLAMSSVTTSETTASATVLPDDYRTLIGAVAIDREPQELEQAHHRYQSRVRRLPSPAATPSGLDHSRPKHEQQCLPDGTQLRTVS